MRPFKSLSTGQSVDTGQKLQNQAPKQNYKPARMLTKAIILRQPQDPARHPTIHAVQRKKMEAAGLIRLVSVPASCLSGYCSPG